MLILEHNGKKHCIPIEKILRISGMDGVVYIYVEHGKEPEFFTVDSTWKIGYKYFGGYTPSKASQIKVLIKKLIQNSKLDEVNKDAEH